MDLQLLCNILWYEESGVPHLRQSMQQVKMRVFVSLRTLAEMVQVLLAVVHQQHLLVRVDSVLLRLMVLSAHH